MTSYLGFPFLLVAFLSVDSSDVRYREDSNNFLCTVHSFPFPISGAIQYMDCLLIFAF